MDARVLSLSFFPFGMRFEKTLFISINFIVGNIFGFENIWGNPQSNNDRPFEMDNAWFHILTAQLKAIAFFAMAIFRVQLWKYREKQIYVELFNFSASGAVQPIFHVSTHQSAYNYLMWAFTFGSSDFTFNSIRRFEILFAIF